MSEGKELKTIHDYSVLGKISQGASGIVYKVQRDGSTYALKLLKSSGSDAFVRFRAESATLARLSHRNLVKIYDVGEFEGFPFFVMDFLEGATLKDELATRKQLTNEVAVQVIVDVADALGELHRHNLLHRDIKPSNIFITSNGGAKLIDLDLVGDIEQIKSESALVGTPLFMSPEQSKVLRRDVDFRSDIYSLGATFYNILTGSPPFQGTVTEIIQKHAAEIAPDPRTIIPEVWESNGLILKKMLAKDPDDRYQSVSGLLSDLRKIEEFNDLLKAGATVKLGVNDRGTLTTKVSYVRREKEAKALSQAWAQVSGGKPGMVLVTGTSGSGKTRLCTEFMDDIGDKNKVVLRAKCQFFDKELPFGPIREALDSLMEEIKALPEPEKNQQLEMIREAGSGFERQLLAVSKSLEGVFGRTEAAKESDNSDGDRELFFNNVADFFLRLMSQWGSAIFFVDDVQWLDKASLQLFQAMLRNSRQEKFLLLGTARDDHESQMAVGEIQRNLSDHVLKTLFVAAFDKPQMAKLVGEFLNAKDALTEIVSTIHERSRGIPFIAIEYLRSGIEQGFLKFKSGHWSLDVTSLDNIVLAGDVFQLIVKRIDSVSQSAKEFLQHAALYGNTFKPDDIAAIVGISTTALEELVSSCLRLGLIEKQSSLKWKFIHDKIPESLVASLNPASTQDLCDRLAAFYAQKNDKSAEEIFILARLLAKGHVENNLDVTVVAHIEAGNLAKSNYAYREAYAYYKFSFGLLADSGSEETKLSFAANLSICATMMGDEQMAAECVDLCIANAKSKAELAHAYALKVWILTNRCTLVEGWETFKHACTLIKNPYPLYIHWKVLQIIWMWFVSTFLEFIPLRISAARYISVEGVEPARVSNMYRDAQMLSQFRGNPVDFYFVSLRLLVMGQLTGSARDRAIGYAGVGFIYAAFGLKDLSVAYFEKAKKWTEVLNDPTVLAWYEMRKLIGFYYLGIIKDYQKEYLEKRDLFHKYLAPLELARFLVQLAWAVDWSGRHSEAVDIYKFIISAAETQDMAVPPTIVAMAQNYLWQNLAIVGRNMESQTVREAALKSTNKLRYCPFLLRQVMQNELMLRRMTHELGKSTDEIVTCWWQRVGGRFADPGTKRIMGQLGIIRLYEFENASNIDEQFSSRLDLTQMLRKMFLSIYSPVYRADYYFLQGAFYRALGLGWLADFYYRKAELVGGKSGNLHVLFDVYCDRAKMNLAKGNLEVAKNCVILAASLAQKEKWQVRLANLKSEFNKNMDVQQLFQSSFGDSSSDDAREATIQRTRVDSTPSRGLAPSLNRTRGTTVHSATGHDVKDMRLIEILLDVTSAFVVSVDPTEQAKSVLSQIVKLFAAERGFIFVQNEDTQEIQTAAGKSAQGLDIEKIGGFSSTVVKKVFLDQKPVVVTGTDEGEALTSESAVLHNLRSIMAVPLVQKGKMLGVVYLDSSLTKGLFNDTDIDLFSTLANQIAVVFQLARMNQVEVEKIKLQHEFNVQAAVATEAKKVKIMVDSMRQALFSVSSDLLIVEPASLYSTSVFEKEIVGKNVFEVLFEDPEEKQRNDLVQTVFSTVFGEDELQWDLMADNLPRKIEIGGRNPAQDKTEKKTLKIQPSPIWNDQGLLERILFVAEDVTTLEALEAEVNARKIESQIIQEILGNDRNDLAQFLTKAAQAIEKCRLGASHSDKIDYVEILRDLHSLKGNARMYHLKFLVEQVHKSESVLAPDSAIILPEIEAIRVAHEVYLRQFERVYGGREVEQDRQETSELAIGHLKTVVDSVSTRLSEGDLSKIKFALRRLAFRSVRSAAQRSAKMADDISRELSKKVDLDIHGDALADDLQMSAIEDCFLHITRNALDHGLETPAKRAASGKAETGTIKIVIEEIEGVIRVSVSDDGRGINPSEVAAKAVEKGILSKAEAATMSNEEKLNLVFKPGFSTKSEATEISGRGVGMDVAKSSIEKLGGNFSVESKIGVGTSFVFTLPNNPNYAPEEKKAG